MSQSTSRPDVTAGTPPVRARDAADAGDGGRRGRGLAPDRLQRAEQPGAAAPRDAGPGPVGHRAARLLAQPGGPPAAHPLLAPDRAALRAGPGGHQQRADGPVPAQPGRGRLAHRPPRAAVLRRPEGPAGRVRRPAPLDRGRRVRRHRHLRRHPAGRLPPGARRSVRRLRPPLGRPDGRPRLDRRRRRPRRRASPPSTCSSRATGGSPGWAGRRPPGSARTAAPAGRRRCARPARTSAGLGVRITDNVDAARMAAHELLEDRSVTGFVCASDTLGIGVLHACAERGLRPGADIGVVGFDDSLAAQVTWPGLTSVRQPLEQVAGRARPDPAPRARAQAARRHGPDARARPSSYAAPASATDDRPEDQQLRSTR